jgi:uncharacterized DUF497 family protein
MSLFEWDLTKAEENKRKHGVSFDEAKAAFMDPNRIIKVDTKHSSTEEIRYFCFGKVEHDILTIRFIYRNNKIRIFGAGIWRQGRIVYEKENQIY